MGCCHQICSPESTYLPPSRPVASTLLHNSARSSQQSYSGIALNNKTIIGLVVA